MSRRSLPAEPGLSFALRYAPASSKPGSAGGNCFPPTGSQTQISFCSRSVSPFAPAPTLKNYQHGVSLANEYVAPLQAKATALNPYEAEVTIFLSHSHKDRELIEPTLAFCEVTESNLYVDWMDEGMPDVVFGETAKKLKERIQQQKKFLVLCDGEFKRFPVGAVGIGVCGPHQSVWIISPRFL